MSLNKDLKIDIINDGDLSVATFDLQVTQTDSEWLAQKLYIKFKTFSGELWLNIEKGIPYFEAVLVKNPDLTFIATLFKSQILEEPLIDSLISFTILEFDSLNRKLVFNWEAQMVSGEIIGGTV